MKTYVVARSTASGDYLAIDVQTGKTVGRQAHNLTLYAEMKRMGYQQDPDDTRKVGPQSFPN